MDGAFADGALTLPQNVLRNVLETALGSAGVSVDYGRKLTKIEQGSDEVRASFGKPAASASAHGKSVSSDRETTIIAGRRQTEHLT